MIRAVCDLALFRKALHRAVEVGDVHDRALVAHCACADVLRDDGEERLLVRIRWWDIDLGEARADVGREVLLANVGSRIHACKEAEVWMARNGLKGTLLGEGDGRCRSVEQPGD